MLLAPGCYGRNCDGDAETFGVEAGQGRMLDEKLNVAGLFTTVLLAQTDGKEHWFTTQSDGMSVCKSPMGMFDDVRIPNDLKLVDTTMRAYYGMED